MTWITSHSSQHLTSLGLLLDSFSGLFNSVTIFQKVPLFLLFYIKSVLMFCWLVNLVTVHSLCRLFTEGPWTPLKNTKLALAPGNPPGAQVSAYYCPHPPVPWSPFPVSSLLGCISSVFLESTTALHPCHPLHWGPHQKQPP